MKTHSFIRLAIIDDSLPSLAYVLDALQSVQPALEGQGVTVALTILPKTLSQTRHYVETMIMRQQDIILYNQEHLKNDTATLFGVEEVKQYRVWLRDGSEHNSEDYDSLKKALTAVINYIRATVPAV